MFAQLHWLGLSTLRLRIYMETLSFSSCFGGPLGPVEKKPYTNNSKNTWEKQLATLYDAIIRSISMSDSCSAAQATPMTEQVWHLFFHSVPQTLWEQAECEWLLRQLNKVIQVRCVLLLLVYLTLPVSSRFQRTFRFKSFASCEEKCTWWL